MANRSQVVKEGYLKKSPPPDKSIAQWRNRFFVLWSSRLMEYYSSSEKRPQDYLKSIDLGRCEDLVAPISLPKRVNVIKLTINEKGKVRDYLFECETVREMNEWVHSLVDVLGFTPAEDSDDTVHDLNNHHPSAVDSPSMRPRLSTPPPPGRSNRLQPGMKFPTKVPPKPPPKYPQNQIASEEDAPEAEYIVPGEVMEHNYHTLMPQGEDDDLDEPQAHYEEMDIDIDELQRNPAPVWKPTAPFPPPTRPKPKRWIRSLERQEGKKPKLPVLKPPIREPLKPNVQSRPLPTPPNPNGNAESHQEAVSGSTSSKKKSKRGKKGEALPYEEQLRRPLAEPDRSSGKPSVSRQPGLPLVPKCQPAGEFTPLSLTELSMNLKGDPKFRQKLQEKREELYDVVDQRGEFNGQSEPPQEHYEEIAFTTTIGDNQPASQPAPLPPPQRAQLKRPPIRSTREDVADTIILVENELGYVDVEPSDEAQDNYGTVDSDDQPSSPAVAWESNGPPLPPRDDIANRLPAPLPTTANHHNRPYRDNRPGSPAARGSRNSSPVPMLPQGSRKASLPGSPTGPLLPLKEPPSLLRRTSSPLLSPPPPPLPSREIIRPSVVQEASPAPRLPRRDRPVSPIQQRSRPPLPLPPPGETTPSPPLNRPIPTILPPRPDSFESPPPVPRRHPQHSDKHRAARDVQRNSVPAHCRSATPPGEHWQEVARPPVPQRSREANVGPPSHRRQGTAPSQYTSSLRVGPPLDPAHSQVGRSKSSPPPPPHKPRPPPTLPKPRGDSFNDSVRTNSIPQGHNPTPPPTRAKPAVLPKPKPSSVSRQVSTGTGGVNRRPLLPPPRRT